MDSCFLILSCTHSTCQVVRKMMNNSHSEMFRGVCYILIYIYILHQPFTNHSCCNCLWLESDLPTLATLGARESEKNWCVLLMQARRPRGEVPGRSAVMLFLMREVRFIPAPVIITIMNHDDYDYYYDDDDHHHHHHFPFSNHS